MSVLELANYTTLRVGGPARRMLQPSSELELVRAAQDAWRDDEWLVLGGGSNVVVGDAGVEGTVIRVMTRGVKRIEGERDDRVRLRVQAGDPWDAVVAVAIHNGWSGIEALSGIPGSMGAAPIQNIGAYGQEIADTLVAVDYLDWDSGHRLRLTAGELELGYRTSALKHDRRGVVIAVELDLIAETDRVPLGRAIRYPQLADALGVEVGERAPMAAIRSAVLDLRASKGMVLNPDDPDSVSAGSFFTNPIVRENFARGLPAEAPRWLVEPEPDHEVLPLGAEPTPRTPREHEVKLSAAWLIEQSGIHRGFALPGSRAAISSKHSLAIVNRGGASASEVVQLAGFIQTRVMAEFGVRLQPEPVYVDIDA